MGKEWERIQGHKDAYYTSAEGYKYARQRRRNEKANLKRLWILIFLGASITSLGFVSKETNVILIGGVIFILGLLGLIFVEKRKRAR